MTDDVLEGRGGHQHHVVGVAVEPNIVGHHANRVDLSVDERHAVQNGDDGFVFIARVDDGCLRETVHGAHLSAFINMFTLLHEHGVEGTILGGANVPLNAETTTFIIGHIADRRARDRVGGIVVVEFTRRDHGTDHGHVREVFLSCFINTGETNPNGHARRLGDDRLIAFVGRVRGKR